MKSCSRAIFAGTISYGAAVVFNRHYWESPNVYVRHAVPLISVSATGCCFVSVCFVFTPLHYLRIIFTLFITVEPCQDAQNSHIVCSFYDLPFFRFVGGSHHALFPDVFLTVLLIICSSSNKSQIVMCAS